MCRQVCVHIHIYNFQVSTPTVIIIIETIIVNNYCFGILNIYTNCLDANVHYKPKRTFKSRKITYANVLSGVISAMSSNMFLHLKPMTYILLKYKQKLVFTNKIIYKMP